MHMAGMIPNHSLRKAEQIVLVVGLGFLGVWVAGRIHRALGSRAAIARFHGEEARAPAEKLSPAIDPTLGTKVDFRLWSPKRIEGYEASLAQKKDAPLGILRIPKINLEVPVFGDTDEITLNRGVGRIQGTTHLGQAGNIGIAGHRDGFFRGLKDVGAGDLIELEVPGRTEQYVVTEVQIVHPEDTSVLLPTATPTLTLVTCFPFYYVGSAPERYVVKASIRNSGQRD